VNGRSWGFNVSEGGLEPPRRGNFPESGKFHVTRIPDRGPRVQVFAAYPPLPLRSAAGRGRISKLRRIAPIAFGNATSIPAGWLLGFYSLHDFRYYGAVHARQASRYPPGSKQVVTVDRNQLTTAHPDLVRPQ